MTTEYLSRVLQMLCQPLQGGFSTGTITVVAETEATALDDGLILVPIIGGCEREESAVKVERNRDSVDGTWEILTTGTPVTVTSLQGGAHVNLPTGTILRFDDPPVGINETAAVATALTGGTRLTRFGSLKQVKTYKDLGGQVDARTFFAAQVGQFPAAVLQWAATTPGDGSASPSLGADSTRVGRGKRIYAHEWILFVVSGRLDSSDRRKREGDVIRDDLLEILTDREAYRGVKLSGPNGIKVIDARLHAVTPTAYIDAIRFVSWFILKRKDDRVFNDWLTTSLRMDRPTQLENGTTANLETVNLDIVMPGHS